MTRKKNKQKPRGTANWYGDTYWQSAAYNQRLYSALRAQVLQLALMRFKWLNLPKTCDERFLEWTLLLEGAATISAPEKQFRRDNPAASAFYSTQMVQRDRLNIYQNPTKWASVGANGWRFDANPSRGVVIYDNITRYPIMASIDLHIRELVDIYRARQMNRMHTKTPYLITAPRDMELTAINTVKQILGGEPAILGVESMANIDVETINTNVPYLGMELDAAEQNTWNRIYQLLGISNLTFKRERQIEDEVQAQTEPTDLAAASPLYCRREAANLLNERFGLEIGVVWRQDNFSENYNLLHNIKSIAAIEGDVSDV